ncbi:MAG: hypothetical protein DMG61_13755 [Acidobacteria bacterium]|nr:MAG: hypothetical protein DMG61_13755 [Acidobacteriota bacterium]
MAELGMALTPRMHKIETKGPPRALARVLCGETVMRGSEVFLPSMNLGFGYRHPREGAWRSFCLFSYTDLSAPIFQNRTNTAHILLVATGYILLAHN